MSHRPPAAEWLVRPADRDVLSDHHGVLGDDLDRVVVLDVHDAAADRLAIGKVDEDVIAWSPTGLGLIHVDQDAPARCRALHPGPAG